MLTHGEARIALWRGSQTARALISGRLETGPVRSSGGEGMRARLHIPGSRPGRRRDGYRIPQRYVVGGQTFHCFVLQRSSSRAGAIAGGGNDGEGTIRIIRQSRDGAVETFTFDAESDGTPIFVRQWSPRRPSATRLGVLIIHGLGEYGGKYDPLGQYPGGIGLSHVCTGPAGARPHCGPRGRQ